MQLDHEIDERAFQFCTGASKTDKTAPAEFCRPFGIEKIQSCAERDVISRLGKSRFLAPAANDPVCVGIFANWNALMWQVCNLKNQIVLLGLGSSRSRIETSDLIADFANAFLQLIGRFASGKFFADLLAQAVAVGIQLLQHRFQFAAFRICTQDLIDFRFIAAAALAGINLYLTVFVTGLAIHFHWITLAPQYQSLEVLGNPWIITIAGILYFLEFFADKIPWVDSIWDAVHTVIRPIGGALLAIQVLGHPSPAFTVIVGLLAGGTSLVAHTVKAATRLASNTSPEPFSNIGLSLGEDAAVLGGLALVHFNPVLALVIFLIGMAAFFYFAPKILRAMKAKIWLAWKKLNGPAERGLSVELPVTLPTRLASVFAHENVLGE